MTPLASWMKLSLRAKAFIVGTVLAAVLAAAAWATYASASSTSEAERSIRRAMQMKEEVQKIRASETDASAQIRAFWITRDEIFAGRARQDLMKFDDAMQKLAELTPDSPNERQRLSQVAALQRSRVERIFDTLARMRSNILPEPEFRGRLLAADDERARLEALIGTMEQEENQLLYARFAGLERFRIITMAGILLILTLAFGSSLFIWILFAYGIRRRIRDMKASLAQIGTGQFVDLEASDELQAVCAGLVSTAENLHQKNLVLENAFHGIAQADGSGHYLSFNKAYAEIVGMFKHEPLENIFASVHGDDWAKLEEALARMRSEARAETQARIVRPDGSVLDVVLTLSGQREGSYYIFLRDNSAQKSAEAALVRAKDAAVASNVAKTSFLAKIGHEIRTPLNAILGTADLLSETSLNNEQAEYVSIFQRNSRRLVALINDFLDFSKIEAGAVRVDKVPFKIRQAIYDVMETFREPAARKGLALDALIDSGVPEWQMGDGHRLQQVLMNLISNAVKFSSAGRVEVRASVTSAVESPQLRFEVADTGPGIRVADRERIFAPFTQVKDPGAPIQGTGLGLTICRELVHLMDGRIGVTSDQGVGSTFYFELPLETTEPPRPALPPFKPAERLHAWSPNQTIPILIAEDSADNRLLLQAYLKDQPVALRFAENGQEVVDALKNGEAFDLILMDLDMPVLNGLVTARWVREWQSRRAVAATPIVALSAHAIHEAVRASLDAGCVAHVSKPVDRRTLLETIARYAQPAPIERAEPRPHLVTQDVAALVPNYLVSQAKHIEEARAQLARHDFDSIRTFGHNLKGTGRGYGFPEIESLGADLERAATESGERTIAETLEALHRFVTSAVDHADDSTRVA
jgi:PAS domain S-box-containing protein